MNHTSEMEQLGNEIAELSAHIHAANFRLMRLIRRFDEGEGWNDGFRSCAHWLAYRTGHGLHTAREMVRVSRTLPKLPLVSEAMGKGELSYSKVRAITRVATPENEDKLMQVARGGTASHVERIVGAWRRVDLRSERDEAQRQQKSRYLSAYTDADGMCVIRGRLTPEVGAAVMKALESVTKLPPSGAPGEMPTHTQLRADAMGLIAERALQKGLEEGGSTSDRYQVVVHVDSQVLEDGEQTGQSVLEEGLRVPAGTSQRIACDSSKVVMQHGTDGSVLSVGRKTRTVPPSLRRALTHRDRVCRFPGCESKFCDAHHIEHWANGGETKLTNLILLCGRHHRALHEDGYAVRFLLDGEPQFYSPFGVRLPNVPEPPELADDPVSALIDRHREEGLAIGAQTTRPNWDGEPVDVGYVVDVLRSP